MPSVSTHNSARRDSSRHKLGCSAAFAFTRERARHPVGSVTADFSADVMLSDSLRYTSRAYAFTLYSAGFIQMMITTSNLMIRNLNRTPGRFLLSTSLPTEVKRRISS